MKCLWHYEWIKLPRNIVLEGKGVLGDWVRLASHAAFRKGTSLYCGYTNTVYSGDVGWWCSWSEKYFGNKKPEKGTGCNG